MSKMKLKPCPFCGETYARVMTAEEYFEEPTRGHQSIVVCDYLQGGCGAATGFHQYEQEAIESWNKRCGNAEK